MKFPRTKAALEIYKDRCPVIDKGIAHAKNLEEIQGWIQEVKKVDDKIREAFWLDTRSTNSYAAVQAIPMHEIRRVVAIETNDRRKTG